MLYETISCSFAAYLLGSIPFGKYIAQRVASLDITKRGSGNIGATNVARQIGIRWGILTLVLDTLKGFLPVVLFSKFTQNGTPGAEVALSFIGLCALLGHQFSIFQGLRGGKGVATALGVYLGISPLSCLSALLLFLLTVYKWDFISLGSLVAVSAIPLFLALFGKAPPLVVASLLMAAFISLKHKDNIRRLLKGEEIRWRDRGNQPINSRSLSSSSSE